MKLKTILCALAAAFTILISGCSSKEAEFAHYSNIYYVFNTYAVLSLYDDFEEGGKSYNAAIELDNEVNSLLSELESSLSASEESSYVYKFNAAEAGATVEIDEHTYNVLQIAYDMYEETDGYYNPAVYYSVDLYGFTARFNGSATGEVMPYDRDDPTTQLPEEKYITAFKQLAEHFSDIKIYEENGSYYAVKPEYTVTVEGVTYSLALDLGGIGKGYAADLVDGLIDSYGFENSYFIFGSSSMNINGSAISTDGKWELNVQNPRGDDYFMSVRVRDAAVSVSGDNNQYYELGGKRYCHIIDPTTGSPIDTGIITAVCIGGTAADGDARTTAICAMGKDRAIEYMQKSSLSIAFLYYDGTDYYLYTNIQDIAIDLDYEVMEEGVYKITLEG